LLCRWGCSYFKSIFQPTYAFPGELNYFLIDIDIYETATPEFFAILLPVGLTGAEDTISLKKGVALYDGTSHIPHLI